jgi:deoxyribose-phosphate aldolase
MLLNETVRSYANMIDHTNLKPFITNEDWRMLCQQAINYGFKTVAINNAGITVCREYLKGSSVLVDAAVSFPLGQCTLETKVFETDDAIKKGAGEVDYVINISEVKHAHWAYIEKEMRQIVEICREHRVTSKVIFENCYLEDDEKKKLCEVALTVKPDYIKTSTGFGTGGATLEDVCLMKSMVGDEIKIKAAGGIRTVAYFLALVDAGANRIGTSSGMKIIEEMRTERKV